MISLSNSHHQHQKAQKSYRLMALWFFGQWQN
jgi:hypothetical protein